MKEDLLKGLSEEQIAKLKECKNQTEILKLAKEEGLELTDEQLEAVSGGCKKGEPVKCPECNSTNVESHANEMMCANRCLQCGYAWVS